MANKVGSIFVELGLQADKFNKGLKSATKNVFTLKNAMIAGIGVAITKMAMNFESGMARVNTLIDVSSEQFKQLSADTRELSAEIGVNAVEATQALYQAISAGVDSNNAIDFLRQANVLALGSTADLTQSVDILTTAVNSYGLSLDEVDSLSNTLFLTERLGKTTLDQLGGALSKVIPTANALGLEIEQVGASFATLTSAGVLTAEAGTKINVLLNELSKSSTKSSKIFKDLSGKSFKEFVKGGGTVAEAMVMMSKHGEENGIAMVDMFGSIEAGSAAMILASENGAKKFGDSLEIMINDTDALIIAAKEMEDTTEHKLNVAISSFKNEILKLADPLLRVTAGLFDFLSKSEVITPVLFAVAGALAAVTIAQIALNTAMLLSPIGVIIVALVALGVGIFMVMKQFDGFTDKVAQSWDLIAEISKQSINFLIDMMNKIPEAFENIINALGGGFNKVSGVLSKIGINLPEFEQVELGRIPKLAQGGIITGETLATIGESGAEAVIPLTKPNPFMDMINVNGNKSQTINIEMGGDIVATKTVSTLDKVVNFHGNKLKGI